MTNGPVMAYATEFSFDQEQNVSLRLLSFYDVTTDSIVTRFDVLMNNGPYNGRLNALGDQYAAKIYASKPKSDPNNLNIPGGTIDSICLRTNKDELAKAFRALADALEKTEIVKEDFS